jgi:hypothetical protein
MTKEVRLVDLVTGEVIKFDYIDDAIDYILEEFGDNYKVTIIVEKIK